MDYYERNLKILLENLEVQNVEEFLGLADPDDYKQLGLSIANALKKRNVMTVNYRTVLHELKNDIHNLKTIDMMRLELLSLIEAVESNPIFKSISENDKGIRM